ncbi:hypothetical protein LINGRAHAP2_LOCUS22211 [Linum grandiflorum]
MAAISTFLVVALLLFSATTVISDSKDVNATHDDAIDIDHSYRYRSSKMQDYRAVVNHDDKDEPPCTCDNPCDCPKDSCQGDEPTCFGGLCGCPG